MTYFVEAGRGSLQLSWNHVPWNEAHKARWPSSTSERARGAVRFPAAKLCVQPVPAFTRRMRRSLGCILYIWDRDGFMPYFQSAISLWRCTDPGGGTVRGVHHQRAPLFFFIHLCFSTFHIFRSRILRFRQFFGRHALVR